MTITDLEKASLAILLYNQDKTKGTRLFTAIACVVRNRVNAGWHGGNWLAVIGDLMPQSIVMPLSNDEMLPKICRIAEDVYDGRIVIDQNAITGQNEDMVGNALYFWDLSSPLIIPPNLTKTANIETVHFYK